MAYTHVTCLQVIANIVWRGPVCLTTSYNNREGYPLEATLQRSLRMVGPEPGNFKLVQKAYTASPVVGLSTHTAT